jgi:CRISPR-associated endonuclease/helicase Cas3
LIVPFYAHTRTHADGSPAPESEWKRLDVHLREVAELAGEFAAAFGAKEWGHLAGLWHNLRKYSKGV